jgi:membrane-associated phospholipid phosphatase
MDLSLGANRFNAAAVATSFHVENLPMSQALEGRVGNDLGLNEPAYPRYRRNAFGSLLLLMGAVILTLNPEWFNRPVARVLAALSKDHELATKLATALSEYSTCHGVIIVALVWYCWFNSTPRLRPAIAAGVGGAFLAGILSRILQRSFTTYPKPIYDPALQVPEVGSLTDFIVAGANTFPSERATLFAGLAIVVFLARPKLGLVALGYTILIDTARIYLGLHYPADLMGSVALGALVVWLAQMRLGSSLSVTLLSWEAKSPGLFYAAAFFVSYQMATAFSDLRAIVAIMTH